MRRIITYLTVPVLLLCLSACFHTKNKKVKAGYLHYSAIVKYPMPKGNINDWENIFTESQKNQLDSIIKGFELNTANQVCIVTVKKVEPYKDLKEFSKDLLKYWKQKNVNYSCDLIIVFSANMRNIWIGTTARTSKVLTDKVVHQIINNYMVPFFKKGEYFEGIKAGLKACAHG